MIINFMKYMRVKKEGNKEKINWVKISQIERACQRNSILPQLVQIMCGLIKERCIMAGHRYRH